MKQLFLILIFCFSISFFGQNSEQKKDLLGVYNSQNNKFEKWSIIELKDDGKFIYKYGLSACQAEITGTYIVEKNIISFKNDSQYLNNNHEKFSPIYPDMSLTKWVIKQNFIKPKKIINSGCVKEKGKHFKQ